MKFWNWLSDDKTGERILRLEGAISDETWLGDEITPGQFREELNSSTGDIVVWINSPGGDVFAATQIYNMLKEYRGKVTVKIDSIAASSASVITMAGDLVEISPTGQMFLHNPETGAIGNTDEFTAAIQFLEQIKEGLITAYELKTKLPRETISKMMDEATWLNAQKAVELGFADSILYSQETKELLPAQMFSQRKVTNSLVKTFGKKKVERRVAVAKLRSQLDEIEQYKPEEWGQSVFSEEAPLQVKIKAGLRSGRCHR